ncbi:MAG TPA: 23S rRNA (adenine(2503)-C(2))-methyltransferase RlmN [bacterium]|nr:23S rRNA (adenine(2503)-C(2))-methyltransferase RlmN [bacterium]HPY99628.1 23S rRNA (adenine(2503)-C(2))-methyltransferase RlmN [bacterium]HQB76256.1 23S rRNA (adenine(2503)-C(2))-methyltransferase RlmN [bacterium]HQO11302.1 23S rRNA (adenine(2503)-C(2))-methyltransferase RlmN [bacterium]HQQ38247.1 23S rRNA (adenine(2503)-C(2))-methyltransferase RlmN [bacterium]
MDLSKLSGILQTEPKFRFRQVYQALYGELISDWAQASVLPLNLRERLNQDCPLDITAEISVDPGDKSSLKALLTWADGVSVETVLMRHRDGRHTICLSSQAGCPLGCAFCATGQGGFFRNLSADEIVQQFIFWARFLKQENKGESINNVVFMGMGEPFLNYEQFIKAVKILNDPEKFNLGSRRMSVSTVGIVEGIKKLSTEKLQVNLAISLHAAVNSLREQLMPIAKKYSITSILKAVDEYIRKTGRRVMFEYIMIKNVNDGEDDALALAQLMKKPLYLVNLIPYNPTGKFQASSPARIKEFKKKLESLGVAVTERHSQGRGISAACGQLAGKKK